MDTFIPDVEQIDAFWLQKWGETFGSPDLALSMFKNDRIRDRVYKQMLETSELDITAKFQPAEIVALNVFITKRERLKKVCGLVVHGKLIREKIGKSDFEFLSKTFDFDDLKLAMSLRDLHPDGEEFEVDFSRLAEMVKRSGETCVDRWREQQSDQMKLRLMLTEDLSSQPELPHLHVSDEHISEIVGAVGMRLAAQ